MTGTGVCSCGHMAALSDIGACIDSPQYQCRCGMLIAWCGGSGGSLGQPRSDSPLDSDLALANKGDSSSDVRMGDGEVDRERLQCIS